MSSNQLIGDASRDIVEVEEPSLLRDSREKHHLKEQIAELIANSIALTTADCLGYLIGFL
jgi:hypothetical protein